MMREIQDGLNYLQDLEDKYHLVSKKTGELHQACEFLVQQQVLIIRDLYSHSFLGPDDLVRGQVGTEARLF